MRICARFNGADTFRQAACGSPDTVAAVISVFASAPQRIPSEHFDTLLAFLRKQRQHVSLSSLRSLLLALASCTQSKQHLPGVQALVADMGSAWLDEQRELLRDADVASIDPDAHVSNVCADILQALALLGLRLPFRREHQEALKQDEGPKGLHDGFNFLTLAVAAGSAHVKTVALLQTMCAVDTLACYKPDALTRVCFALLLHV